LVSLLSFLDEKFPNVGYDSDLTSKIKSYNKLSEGDQVKQLPPLYLKIEQNILESSIINKPSKRDLRDLVNDKFYHLLKNPHFQLIFLPAENQEIILCRKLLRNIIEDLLNQINLINDEFIEETNLYLNPLLDFSDVEGSMAEKKKELNDCSKKIFNKIEDVIDEDTAISMYESAYK